MLQIYHSNRLEALVGELARVTAEPLVDPFRPETIVLQNQGMARWVAQQLAQSNGISARLEFPLPASFLWQVLKAWLLISKTIQKAIVQGIEMLAEEKAGKVILDVIDQDEEEYAFSKYISELEKEMEASARNLQFEKAATIRDKIKDLKKGIL